MNQFTFSVEGVEDTIKELSKVSLQKRKEFDSIVRKSTRRITKDAKSRVNKKTGNLQGSIKARYFLKNGPAATVFPRGKGGAHRHLIEYGTANRIQKKTGRFVGSVNPKPFMKPAHEAEQPRFLAEIKKVVDEDVTV